LERVIEQVEEGYFNIGESIGFMPDRLTTEVILLLRMLKQLYTDRKKGSLHGDHKIRESL